MYQLISSGAVLGTFNTKEEALREVHKREEAMQIYCNIYYFPYEIKEIKR